MMFGNMNIEGREKRIGGREKRARSTFKFVLVCVHEVLSQ